MCNFQLQLLAMYAPVWILESVFEHHTKGSLAPYATRKHICKFKLRSEELLHCTNWLMRLKLCSALLCALQFLFGLTKDIPCCSWALNTFRRAVVTKKSIAVGTSWIDLSRRSWPYRLNNNNKNKNCSHNTRATDHAPEIWVKHIHEILVSALWMAALTKQAFWNKFRGWDMKNRAGYFT